jgi:hypothetical protein
VGVKDLPWRLPGCASKTPLRSRGGMSGDTPQGGCFASARSSASGLLVVGRAESGPLGTSVFGRPGRCTIIGTPGADVPGRCPERHEAGRRDPRLLQQRPHRQRAGDDLRTPAAAWTWWTANRAQTPGRTGAGDDVYGRKGDDALLGGRGDDFCVWNGGTDTRDSCGPYQEASGQTRPRFHDAELDKTRRHLGR